MFEFKDFDFLTDGKIDLKIKCKTSPNEEKGYVPAYQYRITIHNLNDSIAILIFELDIMRIYIMVAILAIVLNKLIEAIIMHQRLVKL
jgi:hypothetical protein